LKSIATALIAAKPATTCRAPTPSRAGSSRLLAALIQVEQARLGQHLGLAAAHVVTEHLLLRELGQRLRQGSQLLSRGLRARGRDGYALARLEHLLPALALGAVVVSLGVSGPASPR
jgi:hypothetical protein